MEELKNCVTKYNRHTKTRVTDLVTLVFCGANGNRTSDTRIFSNKLINSESIVYQLDTCTFFFMVNTVEKTKVVFKLILNLSITICIGTYEVLNFLFLLHNCFCYIAQ